MIFEEEGYLIDCNWNRVAFAGQGGREGYQEENGPLRFFFEMVEKLEALNGFGKIKEVALDTWDIIETSDGAATDPAAFKKAYLSTHSYRAEGDLDDLAVTLVYKESSRTWEWRFGPFKQKADLDKHKLLVFPRRNIGDFETIKGILAHVKVTETGSSRANHKLYQSLCNNTREILSGIV
jgi:hypothetical protein